MIIEISGHNIIFDDCDWKIISRYNWRIRKMRSGLFYAESIPCDNLMHRLIMNPPFSIIEIDHINGNGLDNRRNNLRYATHQQNCQNSRPNKNGTSKFKGVYRETGSNRWRATIQVEGKKKHLGMFVEETDAALAYNIAAKEAYGEFAYLNEVSL